MTTAEPIEHKLWVGQHITTV